MHADLHRAFAFRRCPPQPLRRFAPAPLKRRALGCARQKASPERGGGSAKPSRRGHAAEYTVFHMASGEFVCTSLPVCRGRCPHRPFWKFRIRRRSPKNRCNLRADRVVRPYKCAENLQLTAFFCAGTEWSGGTGSGRTGETVRGPARRSPRERQGPFRRAPA